MLGEHEFYGMGTVGKRGQIVIPAKAREKFNINHGDELIFLGGGPIIHIIKANQLDNVFDKIMRRFSKNFSKMKKKINSK